MAAKNEMLITVRAIDKASAEIKKVDKTVKDSSKSMGEMAKATAIAAAAFGLASRAMNLFTAGSKEMQRLTQQSTEYWGQFGDKIARVIDIFAGGDPLGKKKMGEAARYSLQEAAKDEVTRLETVVVTATRLNAVIDRGADEWARLNEEIAKVDARLDSIATTMTDSFLNGVDAMIDGTKSLGDAFKDMVSDMLRQIARLLANEAIFGLFRGLLGSLFGSGALGGSLGAQGFSPNLPSSSFGGYSIPGMYASGGPVQRGQDTVVGEMGRERFVPSTSGYIQRGGGSGDSFNITIVEAKDARATAQAVMAEIERNRGFRQRLQLS